jgi:A/G-specific adenine glycosylase
MLMDVATVVALRGGRVLLVAQPGAGTLALPGGKLEPGESAQAAALRELREETGIVVAPERLIDLALRVELPGGLSLLPFAVVEPPRPSVQGELRRRWIDVERLGRERTAPAVARSVHRALARVGVPQEVPESLFGWWESRRDELPWRRTRDPYAVLVCEVMSQQTQIERVRLYWEPWIARWPTAASLAAAPLADVLRAWQGLGYPRRARDLHACAQRIAGVGWPHPERLDELPGIGRYTAAAIRCFAFGETLLPREVNVRRVLARRFPGGLAGAPDPWALPGALMDLGRAHCRARPRCEGCPLHDGCLVALEAGSWDPVVPPRAQPAYVGSLRERRGHLLRAALAGDRPRADGDPQAAASLLADGLVAAREGFLVAP